DQRGVVRVEEGEGRGPPVAEVAVDGDGARGRRHGEHPGGGRAGGRGALLRTVAGGGVPGGDVLCDGVARGSLRHETVGRRVRAARRPRARSVAIEVQTTRGNSEPACDGEHRPYRPSR